MKIHFILIVFLIFPMITTKNFVNTGYSDSTSENYREIALTNTNKKNSNVTDTFLENRLVEEPTSPLDLFSPKMKVTQEEIEFGSTVKVWKANEFSWPSPNIFLNDIGPWTGRQIVFSPTGRYVATGSRGLLDWAHLMVWDLITDRKYAFAYTAQTFPFVETETLAFSPDEKTLATAYNGIHLWNITLEEKLDTLLGSETLQFQHILFSKDGSELIASSNDPLMDEGGLITFWDLESRTLKSEKNISLIAGSIDIALSPDGLMLATGDSNGSVILWNLSTNTKIHTFSGYSGFIRPMTFSPDNRLLAIGSVEFDCSSDCSTISIWDISSSQELPSSPLTGLQGMALSLGFSPKNNVFIASESVSNVEKDMRFWKIPSNVSEPWINFHTIHEILGEGHGIVNNYFAISPAENILAFVWSQSEPIHLINIGINSISFQKGISHANPVSSLAFSSLGSTLMSSDVQANLKLWNTTNRIEMGEFSGSTSTILGCSIALSPDDHWLVSGNGDSFIRFYNLTTGLEQFALKNYDSDVFSIAFSPNGKLLASGYENGRITLWNMTDISNITIYSNLTHQVSGITTLAFSHDNTLLASGSIFSSILLWNLTNNKPITSLIGHKERISSLQFSPNGFNLASGSWDNQLIIWNIPSGLINATIPHTTAINSIAYASNGEVILSGSSDGIIRLWEISSRFLISNYRGHIGEVLSLSYSPNNKIFASGGVDGEIILWDLQSLPTDSDVDGMDDLWENEHGLNRFYYYDNLQDSDNDGLMNGLEYSIKSDPRNNDTDGDSITDRWEYLYHSNPVLIDDDTDTDGDLISNLYEFESGLNGLINDNSSDLDNDGLTNFQEFIFGSWANTSDSDNDGMHDSYEWEMSTIHKCFSSSWWSCRSYSYIDLYGSFLLGWYYDGLNPLVDDSLLDLDQDGMPNLWEFQMHLNASNRHDASLDPDFDLVNNLNEFHGGSNPHDFWSVPLTTFSIFHLLGYILIFFIGTSTLIFFLYRPIKKRNFMAKFKAPDYQTAEKLNRAGFPNYEAFLQSESKAKLILEEAYSDYYQGNSDNAIQKYTLILDLLPFSGNHLLSAEASLRLALIYQDKGKLSADNIVFKNIPSKGEDPKLSIFSVMLKALLSETTNNWGEAEKLWLQALNQKYLLIDYELISRKAFSELAFRTWFFEQTDLSNNIFLSRLEEWQDACQKYDEMGSLCHLYILRARYSLASYKFNEVENWLKKSQDLGVQINLPYYSNLIRKSAEDLLVNKEKIEKLSLTEQLLAPEDKERLLKQYIRKAVLILQEE